VIDLDVFIALDKFAQLYKYIHKENYPVAFYVSPYERIMIGSFSLYMITQLSLSRWIITYGINFQGTS